MQTDNVTKIKKVTANDQVYQQMNDFIRSGKWEVGKKIPSEMDLSELFGVNRLTIRLALQRLACMGLLESKTGDGTYVKNFSFQQYLEKASDFYLSSEMLDQVHGFRSIIELESARLAALSATPEEISELNDICSEYENLKEQYMNGDSTVSLESIAQCDVAFHRKVCALSHNQLLLYAYEMAQDLIYKYVFKVLSARSRDWKKAENAAPKRNDWHRVICNGIETNNYDLCKKAYADMVDYRIELI